MIMTVDPPLVHPSFGDMALIQGVAVKGTAEIGVIVERTFFKREREREEIFQEKIFKGEEKKKRMKVSHTRQLYQKVSKYNGENM